MSDTLLPTTLASSEAIEEELLARSLAHEIEDWEEAALAHFLSLGEQLSAATARIVDTEGYTARAFVVWTEVSCLSEQIAALFPARSYAGIEARLNAVVGAIGAGDALRAWALIARYEGDDLDDETRAAMAQHRTEADRIYVAIRQGGAVSFVTAAETA